MPRLIPLLFLSISSLPAQAQTIEEDKAMHFIAGTVIGIGSGIITDDKWKGFFIGCAAGIGKELYDLRHKDKHVAEAKDALATCLGASLTFSIDF